jgi:hypothetical protein
MPDGEIASHQKIALGIESQIAGPDGRGRTGTVVAGDGAAGVVATSGKGADDSSRIHYPNAKVVGIRDEEVAGAIDRHALWTVKRCLDGRAAVARKSWDAVAGDDAKGSLGVHLEYQVVCGIGDVEVVGAVQGDTGDRAEGRSGRRQRRVGKNELRACDGGDDALSECRNRNQKQAKPRTHQGTVCHSNSPLLDIRSAMGEWTCGTPVILFAYESSQLPDDLCGCHAAGSDHGAAS